MTTKPDTINFFIYHLTDEIDDKNSKIMIEKAIRDGMKITDRSLELLCSHNKCRPQTLRFMISHYLKNGSRSNIEDLKNVMNRSLRLFAKKKHLNEPLSVILKVVMYLRRHGGDPLSKDDSGNSAISYAYVAGNPNVLESLLRSSIKNPVSTASKLLKQENSRSPKRNGIVHVLQDVVQDFQDQQGFFQTRMKTMFLPIRQLNFTNRLSPIP